MDIQANHLLEAIELLSLCIDICLVDLISDEQQLFL
jgi:hypothetical protein